MKRCPAIHMPVANATRIVALAHCIVHARALVMKVDQFDIFAAVRGVTGHHDSRRRNDHQGQSGEDDADQSQSALVRHRKTSSLAWPRKARPVFRLGPFASSSSATVLHETRIYCHLFPMSRVGAAQRRESIA